MTPAQLDAIRARNAARTQGKWVWASKGKEIDIHADPLPGGNEYLLAEDWEPILGSQDRVVFDREDASWIAACSEDVPALLAEVDRRGAIAQTAIDLCKVRDEEIARLRAALEAAKAAVNDGRGINSGNNMEFAEEFCAAIDKALRGEPC